MLQLFHPPSLFSFISTVTIQLRIQGSLIHHTYQAIAPSATTKYPPQTHICIVAQKYCGECFFFIGSSFAVLPSSSRITRLLICCRNHIYPRKSANRPPGVLVQEDHKGKQAEVAAAYAPKDAAPISLAPSTWWPQGLTLPPFEWPGQRELSRTSRDFLTWRTNLLPP